MEKKYYETNQEYVDRIEKEIKKTTKKLCGLVEKRDAFMQKKELIEKTSHP